MFDAYGWPHDLTDDDLLQRLIDLNRERAEEEKRGLIRWLRPEYQNPEGTQAATATQKELPIEPKELESPDIKAENAPGPRPCPSKPRPSGLCSPSIRAGYRRSNWLGSSLEPRSSL